MSNVQEQTVVQYNNYSISFSLHHSKELNYIEFNFKFIEHLPDLKSLSYTAQNVLLVALTSSLLLGTYFKMILYKFFWCFRHDKDFNRRPINVLILLGAIFHHVTHLFIGLNFAVTLGFDVHLGDYLGERYCNVTQYVGVFGITYLITGNLIIAILRVIYINRGKWIRDQIDRVILVSIAVVVSISSALFLAIIFNIEKSSKRVVFNSCMGYSTTYLETIHQYQGTQK